jgi:tartrate dehydrogenase/decarboxylase / D-malate dehydrogenase
VGRKPGDIDFMVVRENTEGEYSSIGGLMLAGTDPEFVIQETVTTRTGVDCVLEFAFKLAASRRKKHLIPATQSNGISIMIFCWDEPGGSGGKLSVYALKQILSNIILTS